MLTSWETERAKHLFMDFDSVFKRESKYKQGIWVVSGDDSPVKSGSIIEMFIRNQENTIFPS
jgi:hypothetical protein